MTPLLRPLALAFVSLLAATGCAESSPKSDADARTPDDAGKNSEPGGITSHLGRRDKGKICTEMACSDSASITTKLTPAGAAIGVHEFALELDGVAQTCTVDFKAVAETVYADCSGGASLNFGPAKRGVETDMGEVVSYHEEVIPGEFEWRLSVPGTPKTAKVVHTQAGKTIVEQTATFSYTDYMPNGAGCDPTCKAASVAWTGL